jgi:hypothetical protein
VVDLHALVYVSSAVRLLSMAEIGELLEKAQARNAEQGVTGVLLYCEGSFMQYLEGPEAGIALVYKIIKADRAHRGIIELLAEPIETREFPDWSMAFRVVSAFGMSYPLQQDEFLWRISQKPDPSVSPARRLLEKFWNRRQAPNGGG